MHARKLNYPILKLKFLDQCEIQVENLCIKSCPTIIRPISTIIMAVYVGINNISKYLQLKLKLARVSLTTFSVILAMCLTNKYYSTKCEEVTPQLGTLLN